MIAGSGEVSMAGEDVQVTSCSYLCWILGRLSMSFKPESIISQQISQFSHLQKLPTILRFRKKNRVEIKKH